MTKKGAQVRSDALISRREYARRRGVTENAIRKVIASGILAPALRDGKIDVAAADALLSAHRIGGQQVASNLVKARARKIGAAVALLADEVAELEAEVVPAAGVAALTRDLTMLMAKTLWPLASLAPRLAGLEPAAAMTVLENEVRDRLQAIADIRVQTPRSKGRKPIDGPALSELSPVDLAARRAELQARRLELTRALRTKELLHLAEATAPAVDRVLRAKTKLLALPSKIGAGFSGTIDAAEGETLLASSVGEALAELASDACPLAEIEAARDQAVDTLPKRLSFRVNYEGKEAR